MPLQVCKVYIGSFNADKPIRTDMNPSGEELFNKEQSDLLQDLFEIPQRSCDRKVCGSAVSHVLTSLPKNSAADSLMLHRHACWTHVCILTTCLLYFIDACWTDSTMCSART